MQHYQEGIALGSKTGLSLVSKLSQTKIDKLFKETWRYIFTFERRFSRFLPDSELSMFNRNAGTKQAISPEFRDVLMSARQMAEETNALYNPFILPALQSAGYNHSRVPGHEQDLVDDYSNRSIANIDRLEIGEDWARIPFGTALDLGGCGKGYLADKLRIQLLNSVEGFWLSLGGDIAVGGYDDNKQPWPVSVQSVDDLTQNVATINTRSINAVATSGTTVHKGTKAGKTWHHIIDPRTRRPADTDVLTATVCDISALRADVLASCAVILGCSKALSFLKDRGAKAALLQCQTVNGDSKIYSFGKNVRLAAVYA